MSIKTFSSDLKCPQLKERTESCLPNVCNVDTLVQSLWFWGIPAYPKLIIPNINPLPKSKTPVSITANSCSASCHWSPLAHALMTALQAMTLGSNCSRCRRPRSRNDWCHWEPLSQTSMMAPKVTTLHCSFSRSDSLTCDHQKWAVHAKPSEIGSLTYFRHKIWVPMMPFFFSKLHRKITRFQTLLWAHT